MRDARGESVGAGSGRLMGIGVPIPTTVEIGSKRNRASGRLPVVAFVCAAAATLVGFIIGNRWVLPALGAAAIYPFYVNLILAHRRKQAVILIILWAVFLSQAVIFASYAFPARGEMVVLKGAEYRGEMLEWIKTGEGPESHPTKFVPKQALELAIFCGLAVFTGGLGAIFLGAVLLNYMNFYVGTALAASAHPLGSALFLWQPYAIVRVIGYVMIATALAEVFFTVVGRYRPKWENWGKYAAAGAALVVADIILKSALAPLWGRLIRWTMGL